MPARSVASRKSPPQRPRRPSRPRRPASRRPHWPWPVRLAIAAFLAGCGLAAWTFVARLTAPQGNTAQSHFDTIVVLGALVDSDGNLGPAALSRATEGVREYERGVAPRLIVSGGIDHGKFDEAAIMAGVAEAQGVPASDILLEPNATDTIQNACFVTRLMQAHGWTSAEIVTSPSHLPRAAIVFSKTPLQWRMHAAPPFEQPSASGSAWIHALEILKTARYLVYAQWADRCSP